MTKSLGLSVFLTAVLLLANPGAQATSPEILSQQNPKQLSAAEQTLVSESRKAIVETGLSESYFDTHFKLTRVENKSSDRRVIWQLNINGHEAVITDSIGYYTDGTRRVDTHSVKQTLGRTKEILKTISRTQALKLMRTCIGSFSEPSVQFGPVEGTAELLLVAHKKESLSRSEREERERREAREREKENQSKKKTNVDEIENEGEEGAGEPLIIGYINLQTGKCTRGKGIMTP